MHHHAIRRDRFRLFGIHLLKNPAWYFRHSWHQVLHLDLCIQGWVSEWVGGKSKKQLFAVCWEFWWWWLPFSECIVTVPGCPHLQWSAWGSRCLTLAGAAGPLLPPHSHSWSPWQLIKDMLYESSPNLGHLEGWGALLALHLRGAPSSWARPPASPCPAQRPPNHPSLNSSSLRHSPNPKDLHFCPWEALALCLVWSWVFLHR